MNGHIGHVSLVDTALIEQATADHEGRAVRLPETPADVAREREALAQERAAFAKALDVLAQERIGSAFANSDYVRNKLTVPLDIVHAKFGRQFRTEGGRVVGMDENGNTIMARVRPGEPAAFDEAIEAMVAATGYGERITRSESGKGALSRADFDALPPFARGEFVRGGGRVTGEDSRPATSSISRQAFLAMTKDAQQEFLRAGGRTAF